jgi:hypothetical protein
MSSPPPIDLILSLLTKHTFLPHSNPEDEGRMILQDTDIQPIRYAMP